ncbi:M48 family metallopeptidase [Maribacter sp. 2307ULW6-5]|uniref:M48 family metallopeptidase n=1 Tax=Maribacter sp. 2307ULW6-5 TaxID=3386275 RepID=UPI0039BD2535
MENPFYLYCIIGILVAEFLLTTLLNHLNARRFAHPLPEEVRDVYNAEAYQKSQRYKRSQYRFGTLTSLFSFLLMLGFLLFGGFAWIDDLVRNWSDGAIPRALLFFGALLLGSDLLHLPFAYYHTFVIEERFGFNKTTLATFFLDKLKSWGLMIVVGGLLLSAIIWFFEWAGAHFWLYAWGTIAVFTLLMNLFYSKLIVPLFNQQEPLPEGSLKAGIENYAKKVGFDLGQIFVINGSKRSTKANAYFSGLGKQKRIALYDTLLHDLEEDEIVAVLAHEVGHYKKRHVLFNLAASIALTGLMLFVLSLFVNNSALAMAIGVGQPSFHAALLGFGILYSPVSEVTGLIMNHLSRKFEYQADAFAKETFSGTALTGALKKLSKNNLSNLTPHPAYVFMHYSHPPLKDRIRNLKA